MAMKSTDQALSITDDSRLLAIVDVAKYAPFVGEDWTYEQILDHFAESTAAKTILLWECGDGGDEYCVAIRSGFTTETCFREMSGAIEASASQKHSRSRRTSSSPGKIQSESRSRRMDSAGFLCSAIVGGSALSSRDQRVRVPAGSQFGSATRSQPRGQPVQA